MNSLKIASILRDRSKGIQAYKENILRQFEDQGKAEQFIQEISHRYPRYIRDQLQVIQYAINHFRSEIESAMTVCVRDQLWSANDLSDIAQHLSRIKDKGVSAPPSIDDVKMGNPALKASAVTREMDDYIKILGGVSS